jgi:antitoxin MazE
VCAKRSKIIEIGNSQGVRIPLSMLEQVGIGGSSRAEVLGQEVELEPTEQGILLRHIREPRAGWNERFAAMSENGEDALLDDVPQASSWDEHEWSW